MKIKSIYINNFRSIKEDTIVFPESNILALVGPNNAGKSNVLTAVNNILGDNWFNEERAELNDYYNKDKKNKIIIKITFDNNWSIGLNLNDSDKWAVYADSQNNKINQWHIPAGSSGNAKEDFPCTYLPANRSLEKNLQFKSYELMGKIAKRFNEKAQGKKVEIENKFTEIMDIFNKIPGFIEFKNDFVEYFNNMQSDTPYKLSVDFKAFSPLNYFKTINILANDKSVNNDYDIDIDELGDGNKSLILFALIRSYAKNFKKDACGILAIEEPEIYLHPQARKHLYNIFWEIVRNSNIQIIYTTHSSDFVSTENFSSIGFTTKDSELGTKVKIVKEEELVSFSELTGVPHDKVSTDNIIEFYSVTSNNKLNDGFFAKKLILSEGETEELCIPILFKVFDVDCDSQGISVIGVKGKGQIPKYWRLFKKFGINMLVLFDNDNTDGKQKSNNNIADCFCCTVDDILNSCDIYKSLNICKEGVCEQKLIILEVDFETAFKKDFLRYCCENKINDGEKLFNNFRKEAIEKIKPTGNGQKAQVARYIVKKIISDFPAYRPSFIKEMVDSLEIQNSVKKLEDEVSDVEIKEDDIYDNIPF